MSVLKFSVGRSGAGGANSDYITRLTAAEGIAFHNLDHLASDDLVEARTNAIAYAETREEIELARNKNARTHYRMIFSWKGKESTEKALKETAKYLQNQFPDGKAIIAVHQNTDDTHTHVWLETRKTDGQKIQLSKQEFESLDERWTEQYDAAYGTSYAPHYKQLKKETKQYKRDMYEWRKAQDSQTADLVPQPVKPERAADRKKVDYWRAKEMQETGALKELPQPSPIAAAGEKRKTEREKAPVQPPSEKEQIVERKVEACMLDLKLMLRRQREDLIKEVRMNCYRSSIRKGIPTDWNKLTEFAASAVDHITKKGAGQVRSQIKAELQQGTHLDNQIALDDHRGADRVQSILNAAAENTHHLIAEHTLEGYEKYMKDQVQAASAWFSEVNKRGQQIGVITNEKSGFGTGDRVTEIAIGYEPRTARRGERRDIAYQRAERAAEETESTNSLSFGQSRRGDRTSEDGNRRAEEPKQLTLWGDEAIGDDRQNSQKGFRESKGNEYRLNESADEQRQGGLLRDVSNPLDQQFTKSFGREESFEDKFYGNGFDPDSGDGKSSFERFQNSFAGIESFSITDIDTFKMPKMTKSEPQIIADQNAFAQGVMQMFKESLNEQNIKLGLRAEKIYEAQLKWAGTVQPSPAQIQLVAKFNQDKPPEEQISTTEKSKLEVTYEHLEKLDDDERDEACAAKAKDLAREVRAEQIEELQESRGFSLEM